MNDGAAAAHRLGARPVAGLPPTPWQPSLVHVSKKKEALIFIGRRRTKPVKARET